MTKQLKMTMLRRSEVMEFRKIEPAADAPADEPVRMEASISSEFPVKRWFGQEILGHARGEVDLSRLEGAPVLYAADGAGGDHFGRRVGVVEKPITLDEKAKKIRVTLRFSRSAAAQEVVKDVEDNVLTHVSVGYKPEKMVRVASDAKLGDTMRVTRWAPREVTIVNGVPADPTVGMGRADDGDEAFTVEVEGDEPAREVKMKKVRNEQGIVIEVPDDDTRAAVTEEPAPVTRVEVGNDGTMTRAAEIASIATEYGQTEKLVGWLRSNATPDAVRKEVLAAVATRSLPTAAPEVMSRKDRSKYRVSRAITCAAVGKLDGIEGEVHEELKRAMQGCEYRGGVLIPLDHAPNPELATRAMDSKTLGAGAEVVFDQPGSLISILRNRTCIVPLGATVLPGLTGPVPMPSQTGATTAYWRPENAGADVAGSAITFGSRTLSPKTLMSQTAFSRQLLAQASLDMENLVLSDIGAVNSLALDKAGIHGLGADGEPCGVYKSPEVLSTDVNGIPAYTDIIGLESKIADANADNGSLAWLTTPLMAAKLMTALEMANVGTSFVWKGNFREGTMGGYRAMASTNVSKTMGIADATVANDIVSGGTAHGMIFGNWSDLLIGLWAAMELTVDPYTLAGQGLIKVTSFQMVDVMLRRGVSFAKFLRAKIA